MAGEPSQYSAKLPECYKGRIRVRARVDADAVVVGAGVSGLCTAALLCGRGARPVVLESSDRVGGRTASSEFRGHVLDNGFHIMPFYKASALYGVLHRLGLEGRLELAGVTRIAFWSGGAFSKYPRGISDILRLGLVPPISRLRLLRVLLPMAFSSMDSAARHDRTPLSAVTARLDEGGRAFFDAVCMLAFADVPERVALGEFIRTMIRANPFRGGTSEFAYPARGGYDRICEVLAQYVRERGGRIETGARVRRVIVEGGRARGAETSDGQEVRARCTVVSVPAYDAVRDLFRPGDLSAQVVAKAESLDSTTSVVETHYCTSEKIDERQVVFPIGADRAAKGVFFVSNIAPAVSPPGEHLIMAGTPVSASDAGDPSAVRRINDQMRAEISEMYPDFESSLLWERPMAWRRVESVAKGPGMVWQDKAPHEAPGTRGLFFVGDSTVGHGIGTDSAAHSSVLCHPKIEAFLRDRDHAS